MISAALRAPDHAPDATMPIPVVPPRPVFLVGMMGAGKTSIGRTLARELGREFVDLDVALEARCGVPIPHIFDIEGEAGFRKRETQMLRDYSDKPHTVLATGGGVVLAEQNRQLLKQGTVVYLRVHAEELLRRLAGDRQRPMLWAADPQARVSELLALRTPLYEAVADLIFDTAQLSVAQAAHRLAEQIHIHESHESGMDEMQKDTAQCSQHR